MRRRRGHGHRGGAPLFLLDDLGGLDSESRGSCASWPSTRTRRMRAGYGRAKLAVLRRRRTSAAGRARSCGGARARALPGPTSRGSRRGGSGSPARPRSWVPVARKSWPSRLPGRAREPLAEARGRHRPDRAADGGRDPRPRAENWLIARIDALGGAARAAALARGGARPESAGACMIAPRRCRNHRALVDAARRPRRAGARAAGTSGAGPRAARAASG
jgi:hypothetical protein